MTKLLLTLFSGMAALVCVICYAGAPSAQTAPATGVTSGARNPVIWADVPDPSLIRVDDVYYMSSTTMHMCPGVPIMKSKDLVNWKTVSYAYPKMKDDAATTLQRGKNMYGQGSWASSLRYHKGMYYGVMSALNTGRTYVFKTPDLESGKWEESSFQPLLYDPSLFFDDDDRVYLVCQTGNIKLVELKDDLSGFKSGGFDQVIVPNASKVAGSNVGMEAEGSHFHKINGKYYLFAVTWPRGDMRTQLVFRADKITGPYEGRVFLHDQGVAEGCLIDTPKGDWYAMLFQDNGSVGRTPFLIPVKWEDGWPVATNGGKAPKTLDIPVVNSAIPECIASDEFNQNANQLGLQWQWNHNPDDQFWSLTQRAGFLRLTTGRVDADILQARNTLTQRTFGPVCSGDAALDVSHMKDGDVAGLAAFQKRYGLVGVKMAGDAKSIVMVSAQSDSPAELASVPLTQSIVYLKAECNFEKKTDKAYFSYSLDGKTWTTIGKPLQMSYTMPHFVGYRFALFNYATKTVGGYADFDYFHVSNVISEK
jgi:beta-xylosidase